MKAAAAYKTKLKKQNNKQVKIMNTEAVCYSCLVVQDASSNLNVVGGLGPERCEGILKDMHYLPDKRDGLTWSA